MRFFMFQQPNGMYVALTLILLYINASHQYVIKMLSLEAVKWVIYLHKQYLTIGPFSKVETE